MPLSYPLIRPSTPGVQKIKISPNTQVAFSQSPFTGSEQSFEWPAEFWEAEITMPPMSRASAEAWNAMLTALRGRSGCFLLGDTAAKVPQGSAARSNVNLLAWSEDFSNNVWSAGGSTGITVTPDAVTAPDGNLTADKIAFASSGAGVFHDWWQDTGIVAVAGAAYTFSVWARSDSPVAINVTI